MSPADELQEQADHIITHNPDGTVNKIPVPEEINAELRIGRELDNEVTLVDPRSSRHHAKVRRVSEDRLEIIDIGSANGTLMGATTLEMDTWYPFAPGQVVQIGDTRIMWEQAVTSQSTVAMKPVTGPKVVPPSQQAAKGNNRLWPWILGLAGLILVILLAWLGLTLYRPVEPDVISEGGATDTTVCRAGRYYPADAGRGG